MTKEFKAGDIVRIKSDGAKWVRSMVMPATARRSVLATVEDAECWSSVYGVRLHNVPPACGDLLYVPAYDLVKSKKHRK